MPSPFYSNVEIHNNDSTSDQTNIHKRIKTQFMHSVFLYQVRWCDNSYTQTSHTRRHIYSKYAYYMTILANFLPICIITSQYKVQLHLHWIFHNYIWPNFNKCKFIIFQMIKVQCWSRFQIDRTGAAIHIAALFHDSGDHPDRGNYRQRNCPATQPWISGDQ